MRSMLQNDLGSYAQDAVSAGAASSASGLQRILEIQRDWILNKAAGISENFDYSYGEHRLTLKHTKHAADKQVPLLDTTPGSYSHSVEVQSRSITTNPTPTASPSTPDSFPTDSIHSLKRLLPDLHVPSTKPLLSVPTSPASQLQEEQSVKEQVSILG